MALAPFGTTTVECVFKDREREAEFRLRFPFAQDFNTIAATAQVIADAAQAISNGLLVRITVRKNYADNIGIVAPAESLVTRKMMLYYSNTSQHESISIPSGREDLLETTGAYAGIRLDTSNPVVIAALAALQSALALVETPEGSPFPADFTVGGIAV